jgi:DNA-binding transcriptional regulator YhcF (GntR family)
MWLSIDEKDNRPLYLQIISQIKEQISSGTLSPGDELPSVRELADSLGINLHTVRSAYLKLRDQGIITLRLGRRARIASLSSETTTKDLEAGIVTPLREIIADALIKGIAPRRFQEMVREQLETFEQTRSGGS